MGDAGTMLSRLGPHVMQNERVIIMILSVHAIAGIVAKSVDHKSSCSSGSNEYSFNCESLFIHFIHISVEGGISAIFNFNLNFPIITQYIYNLKRWLSSPMHIHWRAESSFQVKRASSCSSQIHYTHQRCFYIHWRLSVVSHVICHWTKQNYNTGIKT